MKLFYFVFILVNLKFHLLGILLLGGRQWVGGGVTVCDVMVIEGKERQES